MGLVGVGELTEAYVVQQIVGQLDLSAGALELAEITKSEKLVHDGLALVRLDEVDLHDRDLWFTVGFEVDYRGAREPQSSQPCLCASSSGLRRRSRTYASLSPYASSVARSLCSSNAALSSRSLTSR